MGLSGPVEPWFPHAISLLALFAFLAVHTCGFDRNVSFCRHAATVTIKKQG